MHIRYRLHPHDAGKTIFTEAYFAITFQISREVPRSPFLDQWNMNAQNLEKEVGINLHKELDSIINAPGQGVFIYEGSHTEPPCSETVQWFVLEKPVVVTNSHFENLMEFIAWHEKYMPVRNSRPAQPLNNRAVYKTFTDCPKDTFANDVMKGGDFSYLLLLYCLVSFFIFGFSLFADIRRFKGTNTFELGKAGLD